MLKKGALWELNMAYHKMNSCSRRDMVKTKIRYWSKSNMVNKRYDRCLQFTEKDFITVLSGRPHEHTRKIINIIIKECGLDKGDIFEEKPNDK